MKPDTKVTPKPHSRTSEPKQELRPSDPSLISANPQQVVQRLRNVIAQLDQLELDMPTGATGGALLNALELVDQIRDRIRDKARSVLVDGFEGIEGWHVETQTIHRLCKDKEGR
jgi:hypothetical protein